MSDPLEERDRIIPPEIRIPLERVRLIEFYVDLGEVRPELQLLQMIHDWLAEQSPLTLTNLSFHYQPPSEIDEPALLVGLLVINEPIDLG